MKNQTNTAIDKEIILIGGGHCHVLVIRQWAMKPIPGARLTLISDTISSPYSGMLPGLIAGHYKHDDIYIDLISLCFNANVRYIKAKVEGVDTLSKSIQCDSYPDVFYDIASINIGASPNTQLVQTSTKLVQASETIEAATVIPVKPIGKFWQQWQAIKATLHQAKEEKTISVIGGGAGGVELICAIHQSLLDSNDAIPMVDHHLQLITKNDTVLPTYPKKAQMLAKKVLESKNIAIISEFEVSQVSNNTISRLTEQSKKTSKEKKRGKKKKKAAASPSFSAEHSLSSDVTLLCNEAAAPDWPKLNGFAVDERGFIEVSDELLVKGQQTLFAVGDISFQSNYRQAKAGVYAVRQAPILWHNIQSLATQHHEPHQKPYKDKHFSLIKYRPQPDYLSLISTGGKEAIAVKRRMVMKGQWAWSLKDFIDRNFMAQFIAEPGVIDHDSQALCKGCGAKVSALTLQETLKTLQQQNNKLDSTADSNDDLSDFGLGTDDAALVAVSDEVCLAQSVDHITAMVSDPYQLGKIAATHALSDIFAMNAKPQSAQVLLTLSQASRTALSNDLSLHMQGINATLQQHNCELLGGHTSQGPETSLGLVINAQAQTQTTGLLKKNTANPGDQLILTQALGLGVLFAGQMAKHTKGQWIQQGLEEMLKSNEQAIKILTQFNATACTDVTGFGLMGHLLEMLKGTYCAADLVLYIVPMLEGSLELVEQGIRSSAYQDNFNNAREFIADHDYNDEAHYHLLFDPQTSGGLLATIPPQNLRECLSELREHYPDAQTIGSIHSRESKLHSKKISLQ